MLPFLGMTKNLMLVQAWCKKLKYVYAFGASLVHRVNLHTIRSSQISPK